MIYIYALICPESQKPRYVGKTKYVGTRLSGHIGKAKGFHTNNHCANWIRSLLGKGLKPSIVVIAELPNDADWQKAESEAIVAYRAAGHDLTNSTSGGDGFHDMPTEIRAKSTAALRLRMSDPVKRAEWLRKTAEARNTPEVRKKQSDSRKTAWANPERKTAYLNSMKTPEAIARRSAATTARYSDPEARARHSAKLKAIWSTPERSEEASMRSFKAWADPEITERRIAAINVAYSKPEVLARCREIGKEINSRPEVKAIKSAKTKADWNDPVVGAKRRAALSSPEVRAKMSASAKARFAKAGAKAYLSTPERKAMLSVSATLREEKKRNQK
jgi:hypothetical protein